MAEMRELLGLEDGYALWEGVGNGRDAWMVQAVSDGLFVSRAYRTRDDAERGWRRWRAVGRDDSGGRLPVEAMAAAREAGAWRDLHEPD